MSEPYTLKKAVDEVVLEDMNEHNKLLYDYVSTTLGIIFDDLGRDQASPDNNELDDWIAAIKSGKKIVNPMPPREELKHAIESCSSAWNVYSN